MQKILLSTLLTFVSIAVMALPAKPGPRLVVQPNGDTLTVYAHGDEHFHWLTNAEGQWLQQMAGGEYVVVPCISEQEINEQRAAHRMLRRAPQSAESIQQGRPLNKAPRGLVILVAFSDKEFATSYKEMESMINGDNYSRSYKVGNQRITSEGSARQYFIDQSMGEYQPQFDVKGPYTLSHPISYYGQNDYNGNDVRATDMIVEACRLADEDGVDFRLYDANNDGEIDFVYVIYAGYGEADGGSSNTVWPHSFWVADGGGQTVRLDGKLLNTYACGNEIDYSTRAHSGIGTFCHEFSHVLGLPDLYATNDATHKTMGFWDILDAGPYNNEGNTPPAFSAYERWFMGWLKPGLLNAPRTIHLEELQTSNEAFVITKTGECNFRGNDPNPNEFYIVENRQQTGWDEYLPGHGMLITKVKYSYSNWAINGINNNSKAQGVDLIEADGKAPNNNMGKVGDAFPRGATEYTPYPEYPITRIGESDGIITFDFMGGADWVSSLALDRVNTGSVSYTEVVGVYSIDGQLIRMKADGEDLILNDLEPGLYILRTYTGEGAEKQKYKGTKIYIAPQ